MIGIQHELVRLYLFRVLVRVASIVPTLSHDIVGRVSWLTRLSVATIASTAQLCDGRCIMSASASVDILAQAFHKYGKPT